MILGLTGSIGMGKSTAAAMFRDLGVPVWDADAAVHALYGPGGAAVVPVVARFPGVGGAGGIDRAALRTALAAEPEAALDALDAIVHPLVAADRAVWMEGHGGLVVWDVPLLFETGLDAECDRVAVVSVDAGTQRRRILDRGTMSGAELDLILSRQMPDADKRARADYVIPTTDMETARAAVARIVAELT
ncbi:dephospho-CoA kinase [Jannaschia sp. S6380]|uniref:dephospho-CoA kinase n=1 Tax=Jannaschia sp. S6380 TaxID=2926408 RepID=UPI001FF3D89E|nr:dephospho-CoA kinase [Jannaschia sp. S6380]MCK0168440.1 dephospho-CoA kinase [Jannaschia sp. S6380]